MVDLLRQVMPVCGLREAEWPDSCNLNWYINGEDSVGWHADDESLFRGTAQNMSDPYSYTSHKGLKLLPRPGYSHALRLDACVMLKVLWGLKEQMFVLCFEQVSVFIHVCYFTFKVHGSRS